MEAIGWLTNFGFVNRIYIKINGKIMGDVLYVKKVILAITISYVEIVSGNVSTLAVHCATFGEIT